MIKWVFGRVPRNFRQEGRVRKNECLDGKRGGCIKIGFDYRFALSS